MQSAEFFGATTLNITTFIITTLSIMEQNTTLSIDIQHNSIECHYAECRDYLNAILRLVMLNVVMLGVVRLYLFILSVVAPIFFTAI
jgi:hypothetical protein